MACYRVEITDRAQEHFRGHIGYIIYKLRNPDAAWKLRDSLELAIDELSRQPESAPACIDPALKVFGYRKKRIPDSRYICLYRFHDDCVWVEGIYHELQDYENLFATGE